MHRRETAQTVDQRRYDFLKLRCLFPFVAMNQLIHFQVKLRHCAVGSADSGICAKKASCYELLVRTVKYDEILSASVLES